MFEKKLILRSANISVGLQIQLEADLSAIQSETGIAVPQYLGLTERLCFTTLGDAFKRALSSLNRSTKYDRLLKEAGVEGKIRSVSELRRVAQKAGVNFF